MKWDDMAVIGRIARPHGIRGQMILDVETDFPEERFQTGNDVFIERGGVEPLTLTSVRFHRGRPIVGLVGIESIDQAQTLSGLELRVPAERLVQLPAGTFYRHDLVGCRVETRAGATVGVVDKVDGTLAASRLVLRSDDGEVLIPLVSQICQEIDTQGKRIVIVPPEGLLELNVSRKGQAERGVRSDGPLSS